MKIQTDTFIVRPIKTTLMGTLRVFIATFPYSYKKKTKTEVLKVVRQT